MSSISNYLLIFIGVSAVISFIFNFIATTIYDLKSIKRAKYTSKNKNSRKLRKRPLISIIAYSYNQNASIEKFLLSIKDGNYRKNQVILVDDFSEDDSLKIAKNFVKKYPKLDIKIISKKSRTGIVKSISYAIKKYAIGDLIMITNVAGELDMHALKNAALRFNSSQDLKLLTINRGVVHKDNVFSVFLFFQSIIKVAENKINDLFNKVSLENLSDVVVVHEYFKKNIKMHSFVDNGTFNISLDSSIQKSSTSYANEVKIKVTIGSSYQKLLEIIVAERMQVSGKIIHTSFIKKISSIKQFLLLTQPLIYVWFFIVGFVSDNPILYLIGWTGTFICLTFVLWASDNVKILNKIKLSFYLPIMYLVFIIFGITCLVASVIGHLAELKTLLNRLTTRFLNNSPKRTTKVIKNAQVSKTV